MDRKDQGWNGMSASHLCRHIALKTKLQIDSSKPWCKREANRNATRSAPAESGKKGKMFLRMHLGHDLGHL